MIKRNADIERKALSLMLQNEERQLKQVMQNKGTTKGRDNSFSDEYESEDEDESMKIAMKMSEDQAKLDQQKFFLKCYFIMVMKSYGTKLIMD